MFHLPGNCRLRYTDFRMDWQNKHIGKDRDYSVPGTLNIDKTWMPQSQS